MLTAGSERPAVLAALRSTPLGPDSIPNDESVAPLLCPTPLVSLLADSVSASDGMSCSELWPVRAGVLMPTAGDVVLASVRSVALPLLPLC